MKVLWIAGYGPNRSHDTLNSQRFLTKRDAMAFITGHDYWRISRMEYTTPYSPGERTDEIGGADVDREIERTRQQAQYHMNRHVSTKEARSLWQGNVDHD